jgi:hypothetical protein
MAWHLRSCSPQPRAHSSDVAVPAVLWLAVASHARSEVFNVVAYNLNQQSTSPLAGRRTDSNKPRATVNTNSNQVRVLPVPLRRALHTLLTLCQSHRLPQRPPQFVERAGECVWAQRAEGSTVATSSKRGRDLLFTSEQLDATHNQS